MPTQTLDDLWTSAIAPDLNKKVKLGDIWEEVMVPKFAKAPEGGFAPIDPEQKKMLAAAQEAKNIEFVRQYNPNYQMEAFAQGILPVRPDLDPSVVKAAPVAHAAGQVTGLIGTSLLTGGIAPAVTGVLKTLPTVARMVIGKMAQTGATFGIKEFLDQTAKATSGQDVNLADATGKVLSSAAFGTGLGLVGGIPSPLLRIPAEMGYGFLTAKIQGSDNFEAGINAGIFGLFGLLNTANLNFAYKSAARDGAISALKERLMAKGVPEARADLVANRYIQYAIVRGGGWGKTKISDFDTFSKAMKKGWKVIVEPEIPPVIPGLEAPTGTVGSNIPGVTVAPEVKPAPIPGIETPGIQPPATPPAQTPIPTPPPQVPGVAVTPPAVPGVEREIDVLEAQLSQKEMDAISKIPGDYIENVKKYLAARAKQKPPEEPPIPGVASTPAPTTPTETVPGVSTAESTPVPAFPGIEPPKPATAITITPEPPQTKMRIKDLVAKGMLTDEAVMDALKKAAATFQYQLRDLAKFTDDTLETLLTPKGSPYPGVVPTMAWIEMQNYNFDPTSKKYSLKQWLNTNAYAAVRRTIMNLRVESNNYYDAELAAKYKKAQAALIKENGIEPTVQEIADKAQFSKDPKKNVEKAWEIKDLINAREGKVSLSGLVEEGYEPGEEGEIPGIEAFRMAKGGKGGLPNVPLGQGPHNVEMPELVKLAQDLMKYPIIIKKLANSYGYHKAGTITLAPEIFKNEYFAGGVLAHEIGHLFDWLPEKLPTGIPPRGNMIGHVKSLIDYNQKMFGDLSNEVLRDELKAVTNWWHPFDEKQSPSYTRYRYSAKELYADATSVLLNQPEMLQKMAPVYYKAFWDNIDKKPEVAQALLELQEFLLMGPDEKARVRFEDVHGGYVRAEGLYKSARERWRLSKRNLWFQFKYGFTDKKTAVIEAMDKYRKAGNKINPEDNPRYYLEELTYIGGKLKNLFYTAQKEDIEPLMATGMSLDEAQQALGDYLLFDRIRTERADIPNPYGHTPKTATDMLLAQEKKLGPQKMAVLKTSIQRLHQRAQGLLTVATKSGLIKPEVYNKLITNPAYATFQVIDYVDDYITPMVVAQTGTLKGVANPYTATMIKLSSMVRAIERNNTRRAVLAFPGILKEVAPVKGGIMGPTYIPEKEGMGLIKVFIGGKIKGYYVDPYIAHSVNYDPAPTSNMILSALKWANSSYFRPVYVNLNLGFQTYNLIRDFFRAWKLMGNNVPVSQALMTYKKAAPIAAGRIWSDIMPVEIYEMQQNGMLSVTYNDIFGGDKEEVSQMEYLLRQYKILKDKEFNFIKWGKLGTLKGLQPLYHFFDFIEDVGNFVETWSKVAGYLVRKGHVDPKQMAHEVRMYSGSPDFLTKSANHAWSNDLFLFFNAMIQGMRGDIEGGIYNPNTRQGYWWRTFKLNIMPKILMFLGTLGVFGPAVKRNLDKASEYNKTNYILIPVGETENGKGIRIKIPQDEVGRMLSGIVWKGLNFDKDKIAQSIQETVLSPTAGQLPSISPLAELFAAWLPYLTNTGEPYALGQMRPILTDEERQAGVKYSLPHMLRWTAGEMGLRAATKHTATTPLEKALEWIPIIERFIDISDVGDREIRADSLAERNRNKAARTLNRRKARYGY